METLKELARLIKIKNEVERGITQIIGRPAFIGHTGEYIASKIFDIKLETSAVAKGLDGYFNSGTLRGHSVNIKFYTFNEGLLDITPGYLPDYYLVLTGEVRPAGSSKGVAKP
jgi:hypothetical protein